MASQSPSNFRVLIDTREQQAWFTDHACPSSRQRLPFGDYSIEGYEQQAAIERKSGEDFLHSVTSDWERFKAELKRLQPVPLKMIIVESDVSKLLRSTNYTEQLILSQIGLISGGYNVPILFTSTRQNAIYIAEKILTRWHQQLNSRNRP